MNTHLTVRARLHRHDGIWTATAIGRPVLMELTGAAATVHAACNQLAEAVWGTLPTLTLDEIDGHTPTSITGLRVLATTDTLVALTPGFTPAVAPVPRPRTPEQRCYTVPFTIIELDGHAQATVDPDATPVGGLTAGGPTVAVAVAALTTALRQRLRREPPTRHPITSLRLIGTRTLDFYAEQLARRSAS